MTKETAVIDFEAMGTKERLTWIDIHRIGLTIEELAKIAFDGKITPTKKVVQNLIDMKAVWVIDGDGRLTKNSFVAQTPGSVEQYKAYKHEHIIERAEQKLTEWINKTIKDYGKKKREYIEAIERNPMYAIEWRSESMVESQLYYEIAIHAKACCAHVENGTQRELNIAMAKQIKTEAASYLMKGKFATISSSPQLNLISMWKGKAYSDLITGVNNGIGRAIDTLVNIDE